MSIYYKSRARKRGLPPGAAVYVGRLDSARTLISLYDYDAEKIEHQAECEPAACLERIGSPGVAWINLTGLRDVALVETLAQGLKLHPLVLEDILNTDQRPKMEQYQDTIYAVVKMLQWDAEADEMVVEQVSLVLGAGYVLSVQERPGDVFDAIRERIVAGKGRIRGCGADYLLYCLLDAVVDGYFTVLEHLGEKIEALEEALTADPGPEALQRIHRLKREALVMRKNLWPLRELLAGFERCEMELITPGTHLYLRDVYDHCVQVLDTMETFRDMLGGMLDIYLSMVSNRMNEVMKVLTIIATIFIPLTFIAGIYGMNFDKMPELHWRGAYPVVLGVMGAIAMAMVIYFRRKRWL